MGDSKYLLPGATPLFSVAGLQRSPCSLPLTLP